MRGLWTALLLAGICSAARAQPADKSFDALIAAYPDRIAGYNPAEIVWRDGSRGPLGPNEPGKPFERLILDATIRDMFRLRYPAFAPLAAPAENFDPGRFRDKAFFDKLYGDCRKGEVEPNLVTVSWLSKSWGHMVKIAPRAAEALRAVSAEIDAMPEGIRRAAYPTAGTYACRGVADQGQPSMHAYGAAIDLNLDYSNYWLWDTKGKAAPVWRNRMPREIVEAFERHGFIWGGRWYHYDTMHFEYRPELLAVSAAPR